MKRQETELDELVRNREQGRGRVSDDSSWERLGEGGYHGGKYASVFEGTGERDIELICYMFSFRCSQCTYMGMYFDGFIVSKD